MLCFTYLHTCTSDLSPTWYTISRPMCQWQEAVSLKSRLRHCPHQQYCGGSLGHPQASHAGWPLSVLRRSLLKMEEQQKPCPTWSIWSPQCPAACLHPWMDPLDNSLCRCMHCRQWFWQSRALQQASGLRMSREQLFHSEQTAALWDALSMSSLLPHQHPQTLRGTWLLLSLSVSALCPLAAF